MTAFISPQDVRIVTLPWQAAGLTYTASSCVDTDWVWRPVAPCLLDVLQQCR